MPQYLLAVQHQPGVHAAGSAYDDPAAMQAAFERVGAFNQSLMDAGQFVYACGLEAPETATVVEDGATRPGPLNESGWQLGGFWVVEVADDQAALEVARAGAEACGQTLELRKMQG